MKTRGATQEIPRGKERRSLRSTERAYLRIPPGRQIVVLQIRQQLLVPQVDHPRLVQELRDRPHDLAGRPHLRGPLAERGTGSGQDTGDTLDGDPLTDGHLPDAVVPAGIEDCGICCKGPNNDSNGLPQTSAHRSAFGPAILALSSSVVFYLLSHNLKYRLGSLMRTTCMDRPNVDGVLTKILRIFEKRV